MLSSDPYFMKEALREAKGAFQKGEVPVGACLVKEGKIISRAHNLVERLKDPTAHAEILAIREGAKALGEWRLSGCTLYVTKEPCRMCMGAIENSRISRLVYGTADPEKGALSQGYTPSGILIKGKVEEKFCQGLLKDFFRRLRSGIPSLH